MNHTKLLIGSLSNDLYRSACSIQRGSPDVAKRFLQESTKWVNKLKDVEMKNYINKIIDDLKGVDHAELTMDQAEKYLMYSILLQNYALHM